jgi:hypothetical protein
VAGCQGFDLAPWRIGVVFIPDGRWFDGATNPLHTRRSNRRNKQKNDCFKKFEELLEILETVRCAGRD